MKRFVTIAMLVFLAGMAWPDEQAESFFSPSVLNSRVDSLKQMPTKIEYIHEQRTYVEADAITDIGADGKQVRIRQDNSTITPGNPTIEVNGVLAEDHVRAYVPIVEEVTVWTQGDKLLVEMYNPTFDTLTIQLRKEKGVIRKQLVGTKEPKTIIVPARFYPHGTRIMSYEGWNYLDNSVKTLLSPNYKVLNRDDRKIEVGNVGEGMLRFQFRNAEIPVIEKWTAGNPDGTEVERTFSDFQQFKGVLVPGSFREAKSEKEGKILGEILITGITHSQVSQEEFDAHYNPRAAELEAEAPASAK